VLATSQPITEAMTAIGMAGTASTYHQGTTVHPAPSGMVVLGYVDGVGVLAADLPSGLDAGRPVWERGPRPILLQRHLDTVSPRSHDPRAISFQGRSWRRPG
jgi:hypothetical protein